MYKTYNLKYGMDWSFFQLCIYCSLFQNNTKLIRCVQNVEILNLTARYITAHIFMFWNPDKYFLRSAHPLEPNLKKKSLGRPLSSPALTVPYNLSLSISSLRVAGEYIELKYWIW